MKSIFLTIAVALAVLSSFGNAKEKPNILLIVSDDQGYADAGFQGSKDVPTPHLDALAKSGVRCTSGYVSHPFCSPTRAGLLAGRCQARFGHEYNPVYDPLDPNEGLPLTERLLPQFMKDGGYRTGWVGKWHLGASLAHTPRKRGFDETYGFIGGGHRFLNWKPTGRQYTLPLTRDGKELPDVPAHLTTALGDEAGAFIRRDQDKPWFLFLSFNAPHTPHEPTAARLEKFAHIPNEKRRRYLAQVSLMDDAIGTALTALKETGQMERTLVFFFSDNGGPVKHGADNGDLRGQKGDVYEGGVRVPFIVSWPGTLPNESAFAQPVSSLDVFATSLALAGVPMPDDRTYDGVNLIPYLTGAVVGAPHERLFWRRGGGSPLAMREGNWKLIRKGKNPPELYDLASDIGETQNLAAEKPAITARLSAALDGWNKELIDPVFLGSSVKNEDWGPGGANQKGKKNRPKKL